MKINVNETAKVFTFNSLCYGDTFTKVDSKEILMRIWNGGNNTVNLRTGKTLTVKLREEVIPRPDLKVVSENE